MQLDNKCNPSEGVNVANKLVEAKVVAIDRLALQLGRISPHAADQGREDTDDHRHRLQPADHDAVR